MKRSGTLLVILGLLLAAVSTLGVFAVLQRNQAPAATPTPIPTVKLVVAAQAVPERTMLQANMVTLKEWPQQYVPPGAVLNTQDVVGKITAAPLAVGEVVLASKVSAEARTVGIAPTLPPGLVAAALSLSPATAVAGSVRPGDSVDILISADYSAYNENGDESKALYATFYAIQDVPVMAVAGGGLDTAAPADTGTLGARAQSPAGTGVMLTVQVAPQDALLLKYARERGTIDVVLRSPQYHELVVTDPVYLEYVLRRFELPRPVIIRRTSTPSGEAQ